MITTYKKFGTVIDSSVMFKDIENHIFTDYIAKNRKNLLNYVRSFPAMDYQKAEDLIQDTYEAYAINEADNNCYDSSNGHDAYISVEEAVKSRLKLMSKALGKKGDRGNKRYTQNSTTNYMVYTDFKESDDEDSRFQKALNIQIGEASPTDETTIDAINISVSLESDLVYFCKCSDGCRISGLELCKKIPWLIERSNMKNGITSDMAAVFSDIWVKVPDGKAIFTDILMYAVNHQDEFNSMLDRVENEIKECKELINKYR